MAVEVEHRAGQRGAGMRAILLVALVAAAAIFGYRGPMFAAGAPSDGSANSLDFVLVYSASRVWVTGGNPYDKIVIDRAWLDAGGPVERRPSTRVEGSLIYPPATLLMFAPFGMLPWKVALPAWILANVGFLLVSVGLIARLAGWGLTENRTLFFLTLALAFMPAHTTVRVGQTPLYVLAALMAAAWAGRAWARGLGWSAAILIKPQIGLPFLALDVLRRRWGAVGWAIGCSFMIFAVSIAPLVLSRIAWWDNWTANIANQQLIGGQGDPTPANPMRHQLINLQYPLHEFFENRALVNALVLMIVGALAIVFFRFWILDLVKGKKASRHQGIKASRDRAVAGSGMLDAWMPGCLDASDYLRSLSMVAVLSLLIVYHRFYDAVILLLPLAWAIDAISRRRSIRAACCVLLLLLPFFLNSATAFYWLKHGEHLPEWLVNQSGWDGLIMPHQSWALLLMAMCLIWGQRGDRLAAAESSFERS